jgi:hypothetical protein
MKGTYKGQDLSGNCRFTDTWVKRNGKWQVVASQYTKVLEAWPTKLMSSSGGASLPPS